MRNKIISSLLISALLVISSTGVLAADKKVLFYEGKTSGSYSIDPGDYSQFANALRDNGYDVDKVVLALSDDVLRSRDADVVVIAGLGSDLSPDEMTALFRFVMEDGKGLLICGANPTVNKITTPLGMAIDPYILEDKTNQIRDISTGVLIADNSLFYIDLPMERKDPVVNALTKGVSKIHFFGGNGLYVFGNAKAIIRGDGDTNSLTSLRFSVKGTYPPVAACTRVGNGSLFLLSDPDMLSNSYNDPQKYRHDNMKLAINMIDWLSTPIQEGVSDDELKITLRILEDDKVDLEREIKRMENKTETLRLKNEAYEGEISGLNQQIANLEKDRFLWFTYQTWAMLLLGLAILLIVIVAVKKMRSEGGGKKDSSLGYEFGDKPDEGDEFEMDNIQEDDVENRLEEFNQGT